MESDRELEVEGEVIEVGGTAKREHGEYREGDRVVVRPPAARCTTEWTPAVVTEVKSSTNVEVDGIPRHVSDLRLAPDRKEKRRSTPVDGGAEISDGGEGPSEEAEDYRARFRPRPANPPSYRV